MRMGRRGRRVWGYDDGGDGKEAPLCSLNKHKRRICRFPFQQPRGDTTVRAIRVAPSNQRGYQKDYIGSCSFCLSLLSRLHGGAWYRFEDDCSAMERRVIAAYMSRAGGASRDFMGLTGDASKSR